MAFFQYLIYGLVSGFAELFPISGPAHQSLLRKIFGWSQAEPTLDLLIHIAILAAVFYGCKPLIDGVRKSLFNPHRNANTRKREYDLHLIKTAFVPFVVGQVFLFAISKSISSEVWISLFLILNGIVLIVPEYMRHSNRDASIMSGLDGIVLGISASLSGLTGISRNGVIMAYGLARGVDRKISLNWAFYLTIPALFLYCIFDIVDLIGFGFGIQSFTSFLLYLVSAIGAFCGGYLSCMALRFIATNSTYSGFAFYCWGAALFNFIIYLIA